MVNGIIKPLSREAPCRVCLVICMLLFRETLEEEMKPTYHLMRET